MPRKAEFIRIQYNTIQFALTSVVGIFYYKENESRTFVSGVKCKLTTMENGENLGVLNRDCTGDTPNSQNSTMYLS